MKAILTSWLCLFFFCPLLPASTHYVDSLNGNDNDEGNSPTSAWKTIAKVNASTFQSGDVLLFRRGGVWREQLNFPSSGSAEAPITIDAYGEGSLPLISGADLVPLGAWSVCITCPAHTWQAPTDTQPNIVIFDGIRGNKKSSRTELRAALDWFWEGGSLWVFSDGNPAAANSRINIEIGARPSAIFLTGRSYIHIKNIQVTGANAAPYGEGAGIWAATVHLAGPTADSLNISHVMVMNGAGEGIHLENANHSSVDSSEISNNEGAGIKLSHTNEKFPVTSGAVTNNVIHHNHFDGIFVVGCPRGERCRSVVHPEGLVVTGINITGNKVYNNGAGIYLHETNESRVSNNATYSNTDTSKRGEGYCVGLSGSSSNIVEKNNCYQARLAGIELSIDTGNPPFGSSENIIRYNVVHDNGTHGIFTNYVPSQHNQIFYNLIYNHPQGSCIMANYVGHEIYNNTCYNNRQGIHLYVSQTTAKTGNISVKNNIIAKSSQHAVLIDPGVDGPLDFSNNNYYPDGPEAFRWKSSAYNFAAWRAASNLDRNSILADPQFSSSSPNLPRDFALRPGSPDIAAGVDLGPQRGKPLARDISWPDRVTLATQSEHRWDIGAFAHQ